MWNCLVDVLSFIRMRTRWTYVQPQVKRLQSKDTVFAPVDNTRCVIVGSFCFYLTSLWCWKTFIVGLLLGSRKNKSASESNTFSEDFNNNMSNPINSNDNDTGPAYNVLNGNVVDTTHYHVSNQRIHSRRSRILEKTADLRQFELDKTKTYVYSHAVRYWCF